MEIKLNSGVIISSDSLVSCYIAPHYTLESELHFAKTGEICNSRTQMRITTHALAHNFPICLIIEVYDDDLEGKVYLTEFHPDINTAKKRIVDLMHIRNI